MKSVQKMWKVDSSAEDPQERVEKDMNPAVYRGSPCRLWNPFTVMDEFEATMGFGPLVITRGEGPYVFNERDERFINGYSSLWNVALGHGREELAEAAAGQMRQLAYASCFRQTHPRAMELAARLVEITGEYYSHVYLGSNGSEAVETALKMARQYHRQSPEAGERGRCKIVSLRNSYHGVSYGAISTSGEQQQEEKFGPLLPGFVQIEPPYCYRCPYGKTSYPDCGLACARALEEKIDEEGAETVAAFVFEPVMGVHGMIPPPEEYYARVGEICSSRGVLLIADEVTTGFGRTGKLFASQDWPSRPDILCLGKAISSGYLPLSATLATENVFRRFNGQGNEFNHGSTAAGHPVCAAVGLATIDIILREHLVDNAARMGDMLLCSLKEVLGQRPHVGDIRGRGLMIGIELVQDRESRTPLPEKETLKVAMDCMASGLLVFYHNNVLGLLPPLIVDRDIAAEMVRILDEVLDLSDDGRRKRDVRLFKEFGKAKKWGSASEVSAVT